MSDLWLFQIAVFTAGKAIVETALSAQQPHSTLMDYEKLAGRKLPGQLQLDFPMTLDKSTSVTGSQQQVLTINF